MWCAISRGVSSLKRDARRVVLDELPARRDQAEAGDDDVRLAGELLEHLLGLGRVRRLAEDLPAERDGGVDAEHRPLAGLRRDRARLAARVLAHEPDRVGLRRVLLDVRRREDVVRDPELVEDHAPLRARRRQEQRLDGVRAHRLRAFQISSHGHFFAHSASER